MVTSVSVPEWKEWMMNPQEIKMRNVGIVLGKGDLVVHLRSGYDQKNIPEYFTHRSITLEALEEQVRGYEVEPKMFPSAQAAAGYIRDNSFFVEDTYVLNPPGTTVFFVYQLGLIRNLKDLSKLSLWNKAQIFQIIDSVDLSKEP
jgi:hypothetical protein